MIDNADKNGNKKLDFDEFASFMVKKASVDGSDERGHEMREAFKIFDKNRDGFISRSELKVRSLH
jgi:Ca2+-binding EF-hand superfamily protein